MPFSWLGKNYLLKTNILKIYMCIPFFYKDFYTCEHWLKLPESLRDYFDAVDPPELSWMLAVDGDGKQQLSVRW